MVARARHTEEGTGQYEYYSVYKNNLKREAAALAQRLRGTWVWRSLVAVNDDGDRKLVKMPPYRRYR